ARLQQWSLGTQTGDLAEVPELSDSHPVRARVTSTRDSCSGSRCVEFSRCHVFAARRAAAEADVVVVNHHLLMADLTLKEEGFGDILPSADAVILDEAHQIPDLAAQFFGTSFASRQVELLQTDVHAALQLAGLTAQRLATADASLQASLLAVGTLVRALTGQQPRIAWQHDTAGLDQQLAELSMELATYAAQIRDLDGGEQLGSCAERALALRDALDSVALAAVDEGARTLEAGNRGFSLQLLPFDIGPRFRSIVDARRCAWVFTSATLSLGEDFTHFSSRLGLTEEAATLRIESPFDYERQSLLYLPPEMPDPAAPGYVEAVTQLALGLLEASQGGAFLLFTSHRALERCAALLRVHALGAGAAAPLRLLVQGDSPRELLLQEFRRSERAVLLGTSSFWEGVDVKGPALRLVIIDKLPFASPDDPLTRARVEHIRSSGGNPFRDYQLPEAALALKQGVGRLIRSEQDEGVVVICDPRLTSRSYGRILLASLPPLRVSRELPEVSRFLRRLRPVAPRTAALPDVGT
ncbi:MAG: ATP-dependent DNA helicase, partial [Pseudomonadota bacterium]